MLPHLAQVIGYALPASDSGLDKDSALRAKWSPLDCRRQAFLQGVTSRNGNPGQEPQSERPSLHDESGGRYAADRLYEESEPDSAVANHESSFRIRF